MAEIAVAALAGVGGSAVSGYVGALVGSQFVGALVGAVASAAISSVVGGALGLNKRPKTPAFTSAATDRAAPTNDVMNASSNVGGIYEGGSKLASPNFVLSASLTINNGLRPIRAVGSLPNVNVNAGTVKVTGELTCYYGSNAVLTKIRNSTASSFDVPLIDPSGTKAIIIDVPRLKYTDGNPQIPGRDTDRTLPSQFGGMRHPQHGFTVSYSRCEEFA